VWSQSARLGSRRPGVASTRSGHTKSVGSYGHTRVQSGTRPWLSRLSQLAGLGDEPRVMNSMCGFFSNKINHNKIYCFYKKIF
jgi:hypothetical protein